MAEPIQPTPAPRRDLDALAAHHRLGAPALEVLFSLAAARPTPAEDARFLRLSLGLAGVLSLCAGVIFFVAANWQALPASGRFVLLEALLGAAGVAALVRPPPDRIGKLALLAAFLLTGALLALFGQTYQTGADVHELFLAWAGLGLPLVLLAGSSAAWGAWVLVLDVALGLLLALPVASVVWTLLGGLGVGAPALFALATLVNVALWAASQALARSRFAGAVSLWLERVLMAAAAGFAGLGAVLAVVAWGRWVHLDGWTPGGTAVLAIALLGAGAGVARWTLRLRRDVFPLAAIAAVCIAAGTTALVRALDRWHDAASFFLLAAWLVGASTATGSILMRLVRRWRDAGTLA